ncbi:MAG: lipopolysaccharide transport periplasmic protein LptA [Deltaproteobacteria bacterium]|nr:lipopolysaccharide transport periplasmic protein LptA [Deltaproteobacteria bacterium]
MRILAAVFILVGLLSAAPAAAQTDPAQLLKGGDDPLVIRSETLEIDNKNQMVIFTGNVDARKSTFTIQCRKMHLYYLGESTGATDGPEDVRVDRVVATGDVKIVRSDGGEAMADKAVYYQKEDKVILTGNPMVKQGEDFVEGSQITFFIGEKRSIVESSGSERVRAVIFPGNRKR